MVTFKNGKQIETVAVYGGPMTFQGANRETLEFRISEDNATFDELKAIYTDSGALSEIEVKEVTEVLSGAGGEKSETEVEDGTEIPPETKVKKVEVRSLHLHYTIPVELGLRDVDGEQLWCMKVAQKSEIEIEQAKLAADMRDMELAFIALDGIVSGGEN